MTAYDFSGLTKAQKYLLTMQGWTVNHAGVRPQPSKRTVAKLIERGLVIERLSRHGIFSVREYDVPVPVHMAWCARCVAVGAKYA